MLIDSLSLVYMTGSEIDFVDNLLGQSFQIKNPNAVPAVAAARAFPSEESGVSAEYRASQEPLMR